MDRRIIALVIIACMLLATSAWGQESGGASSTFDGDLEGTWEETIETFSGDFEDSTEAQHPTNWTAVSTTDQVEWRVRTGGSLNGQHVRVSRPAGTELAHTVLVPDQVEETDNTELLVLMRSDSTSSLAGRTGVIVRGSEPITGGIDGYVFSLVAGGDLRIEQISGDSGFNFLDSTPTQIGQGEWFFLRGVAVGETLLARAWSLGDVEPQEWQVEAQDIDLTSGFVGLWVAQVESAERDWWTSLQVLQPSFFGHLSGDQSGSVDGSTNGQWSGDVAGSATGTYSGTQTDELEATATGEWSGSANGTQNGTIGGNITGEIRGGIDGSVSGGLDGTLAGNVTGTVSLPVERRVREYGVFSTQRVFGNTFDVDFTPYNLDGDVDASVSQTHIEYWASARVGDTLDAGSGALNLDIDGQNIDDLASQDCENVVVSASSHAASHGFSHGQCTLPYQAGVKEVTFQTITSNAIVDHRFGLSIRQIEIYNYSAELTLSGALSDATFTGDITNGVFSGSASLAFLNTIIDDGTFTGEWESVGLSGTHNATLSGTSTGNHSGTSTTDFTGTASGVSNETLQAQLTGEIAGIIDHPPRVTRGTFTGTQNGTVDFDNITIENVTADIPDPVNATVTGVNMTEPLEVANTAFDFWFPAVILLGLAVLGWRKRNALVAGAATIGMIILITNIPFTNALVLLLAFAGGWLGFMLSRGFMKPKEM